MSETSLVDAIRTQLDRPVAATVPAAAKQVRAQPPESTYNATAEALADVRSELETELEALQAELQSRMLQRRWDLSVLPVFRPLLPPARYKGAFGGRGGAKSHFFGELLLTTCSRKPIRAVCVREIQRSLEQSVKRLLEDKIRSLGFSDSFTVRRDSIEGPHGGLIIFQGMQDHTSESIKSLEGFDIAWVEEAQMLSDHSLELLRPTIRKDGSELWFSWNPQNATDPVDKLLRSKEKPPSSVVVETSYNDNPHLPEALRREIEWDKSRDADRYAHIWLGAYKKISEAAVFRNWKSEAFETPAEALFLLGADWGFATSPSALVRVFTLPNVPRTLFIDAEAYEVGCEIEDTPALFDSLLCGCPPHLRRMCVHPLHGWARKRKIRADSARPETISHMQRHGYPLVEPATKGKNSVEEGITFLKGFDIVVHPRCQHTIDELTFYSWAVDKRTGLVLPELVDEKNHIIDSTRYAVELLRNGPKTGGLIW